MAKRKTPKQHLESAIQDLGKRFGKLTVVEITDKRSTDRKIIVRCKCDCESDEDVFVRLSTLRVGNQTSCGCTMTAEMCRENGRKAFPIMVARGLWEKDARIATARRVHKRQYDDEDLTFEQFLELSQQNCFYCDEPPSNGYNAFKPRKTHLYSEERLRDGYFVYNGLDRVDNSRGHFVDNVVPCCCNCNKAKLDRDVGEFYNWIRTVYNHLKLGEPKKV